jgi:hypothetical protein
MLVTYFMLEGFFRLIGATLIREVVPTFPLWLVSEIHEGAKRRRATLARGPRVPDRVTRGDGHACDWCVESWEEKPEWRNPYAMIEFREAFYEIVGRETRPPPRPHVYLLRKPPSWKLVVKPIRYDPPV